MRIIVTASSHTEDEDLPWVYSEDAFVNWVDEVFRESYKRDVDSITTEQAVELVRSNGYTVEVKE